MPQPTESCPYPEVSSLMTVGEFLTTWHAANEHHNRFILQESPAATLTRINRDIIPMIGGIPIGELDGVRLITAALALEKAGAYADAMAVQNTILAAFSAAERLSLLSPSFIEEVRLIGMMQLWENGWRFEDFLAMVVHGGREDAFDAFQLMWATDLEPHEIVALRWSDLDKRQLWVRHTLGLVNGEPAFGKATPLSGERIIRLDYVEDELFDTHRLLQTLGSDDGDADIDRQPIFPGPNGDFQTPSSLQEAIDEHTDRVGAPRIALTYIRYLLPMLRIFPAILGDQSAELRERDHDSQRLAA